jgi:hypothetical protein
MLFPGYDSSFLLLFFYAFGKFLPLKVFIGLSCNFCIRYTNCSTQLAIMLSHLTTEPFLRRWVLATLLDWSFPCHLLCPRSLFLCSPAIFFVLSPFSFSPIKREKGKGCYCKVLFFCLIITKFDLGGERGPFYTSRRACHCNCVAATIPTAT